MSEFDQLKDKAEQYGQDHPDKVQKAEDAVEGKLGIGQDQDQGQQDQGGEGAENSAAGGQDTAGQSQ